MFYFIIITLFIALISSCATLFYGYIIGNPEQGEVTKGRIFSRFGLWLENKYLDFEAKEGNRIAALINGAKQEERERIARKKKLNWYKAIGVCPICCNPYWVFLTYIGFVVFGLTHFHLLSLFSSLVLSSFLTRVSINKLL